MEKHNRGSIRARDLKAGLKKIQLLRGLPTVFQRQHRHQTIRLRPMNSTGLFKKAEEWHDQNTSLKTN
ncbi:MAG: hypothetical protein CMM01_19890 [Rhodopirellula sp.]|nr:hypothetical protein [Rhodopirellula sp.]